MTALAPEPAVTASAPRAELLDLRGPVAVEDAPTGVLEDPTGGRRRLMRRVGIGVAGLLGLWLLALLLSGLGLFPRGSVPLARALGVAPRQDAAEPHPARPAAARTPAVTAPGPAWTTHPAAAPRNTTRRVSRATVRRDAPAETMKLVPGRARTVPGRSTAPGHATAPGQGSATAPGKSASAPGRSQGAPATGGTPSGRATAPGQSTSSAPGTSTAPGQTGTAHGSTTAAEKSATPVARSTR
jgi:hypothetical protein